MWLVYLLQCSLILSSKKSMKLEIIVLRLENKKDSKICFSVFLKDCYLNYFCCEKSKWRKWAPNLNLIAEWWGANMGCTVSRIWQASIKQENHFVPRIFWHFDVGWHRSINIKTVKLSVIRQKGKSQNGCFKKTKHVKFPTNEHF